MKKISVITVSLNAAPGLERTILSVLGQDFPGKEFLVIDGGSADETPALIRNYENHFSYWCSEPDRGIYDAMNKGLAKASGEWVIFMNAGDTFADAGVLSRIFDTDRNKADVIYGDCTVDYGRFRVIRKAGNPGKFLTGMPFSHQSMLVRTELVNKTGFDLKYRISADFDMVMKLIAAGKRFDYSGECISMIEIKGISHRNMARSAREHFQIASFYGKPALYGRLVHRGRLAFLYSIMLAYKLLPMGVMLFFIKLINRNRLVEITGPGKNEPVINPAN